jgi:hypothetical protein
MACRAAVLVLVFTLGVCYVKGAPADPVIVIRNGTVSLPYTSARPRVALGAAGIDLSALFGDGMFKADTCHPCRAGGGVGLAGSLSGTAIGQQYIIASNFSFDAADLEVPRDGRESVTLTAPFTFEGRIALSYVREPRPEDTTLSATVVGSGTATVHLSSTVDAETGERLYFFEDLIYEFTPPSGQ